MKMKFSTFFVFYFVILSSFLFVTVAGSRAVTAFAENQPVKRQCSIVIDAGHGGIDGGATSCTGVLESNINLEISMRLKDLLHLLGYHTVMIRTTDTSVYTSGNTIAAQKISDLKERVRIVNETENAILLSIHQNTFSESKYSGAQVFYAGNSQSKDLASQIQNSLIATLNPDSHRKAKASSGVYLMDHINCTGILVECGFLSNPEEEAKLRNAVYQQKLCCVIAGNVAQFVQTKPS